MLHQRDRRGLARKPSLHALPALPDDAAQDRTRAGRRRDEQRARRRVLPRRRGLLDHAHPSIYWEPYGFKADRSISDFLESAAQENSGTGVDVDYTYNVENPLSQNSDFAVGLQPGDITKYSAVP